MTKLIGIVIVQDIEDMTESMFCFSAESEVQFVMPPSVWGH